MKEFLKDIFIESLLGGDWFEWILGGLMWLFGILVVGIVLWFGVWLIDSAGLPIKQKEGIITNRYIIPAHSETVYYMSGKVMIPVTTFYDTEYKVEITIDGLTDCIELNQEYWNTIKVEQLLCCKYTNGRILRSLYIKSVDCKN